MPICLLFKEILCKLLFLFGSNPPFIPLNLVLFGELDALIKLEEAEEDEAKAFFKTWILS